MSDIKNIQFPLVLPVAGTPPEVIRGFIMLVEQAIRELPDSSERGEAFSTLDHKFADGVYTREITVQAGTIVSTVIHKFPHHVFVLKGRVSVFSEFGVEEVVAPCSFISPAGIKRICYIHEETVWTTVHPTKETDPEKIMKEITAKSYKELGLECSFPKHIIEGDNL